MSVQARFRGSTMPPPIIFGTKLLTPEPYNYLEEWGGYHSGLYTEPAGRIAYVTLTAAPQSQFQTGYPLYGQTPSSTLLSAKMKNPTWFSYGFLAQAPISSRVMVNDPLIQWITAKTSSEPQQVDDEVTSPIEGLFALGDRTDFEDGVENKFTQQLTKLVRKYGGRALEALATQLFPPDTSHELAAQALLCLGRIENEPTYLARSWILQRGLLSPSAKVRDAAAVGIASLGDVHAKQSLQIAIQKETIQDLKEDMQEVLSFL